MRQFISVIRRDLSVYLEKKSTFVMAIAFFSYNICVIAN